MLKLKSYSDYGHGWIAVKRKLLVELDILEKITPYSHESHSRETVYLEEDCDASTLVNALNARGQAFEIKETFHFKNSRIRNLPRFNKG